MFSSTHLCKRINNDMDSSSKVGKEPSLLVVARLSKHIQISTLNEKHKRYRISSTFQNRFTSIQDEIRNNQVHNQQRLEIDIDCRIIERSCNQATCPTYTNFYEMLIAYDGKEKLFGTYSCRFRVNQYLQILIIYCSCPIQ